eukprot:TRINITY_DN8751_c0_g1_i1.p1 TRINITY_DN8751_c0_g1~~TRINITY_DN8751_c0_g1_i1.p1  ORF type:complete len:138 (-),score=34.47 TRINITY_DN8751_c0_g1_i1:432-845(-)
MKNLQDAVNECIEQLYSDGTPSQILEAVKGLVSAIPPTEIIPNLDLTPVHHCCIVMDKLKDSPELIKQMLAVLIKADKGKHRLFSDFFSPRKTKRKFAKLQEKSCIHYLSGAKKWDLIELLLKILKEMKESTGWSCE